MVSISELQPLLKRLQKKLTVPTVWLGKTIGISPCAVTFCGVLFAIAASVLFSQGIFNHAFWLLLVSGFCDMTDGDLARKIGDSSKFGAFLDSLADRVSDIVIMLGLAYYYLTSQHHLIAILALMGLIVGMLISYARARALEFNIHCEVGFMTRAPRFVLLLVGAALGIKIMPFAILAIVAIGTQTVGQRIQFVKQKLE
ncbi:MAG: hypothetical protein COY66_06680 [Candidatus Kerfeldbacteria bacterium CG_4_10_14_0_8_um_filter_42_10]|uniref:CDP-alcohol phosphatidyltransferase family protein n=1 Tax=Candidatus Kerfeldbacteria bacterium CG_4_10_14_0_8_um_filter_42_10 TaxID=2014248 RepID=A0A2M7RFD8_9BACT|nr:MAG: hypothetical protein COY66_06680 [Candidatus Kerfeldbacteria bacterium CG_4_10_14_0_8_um_filter_42_10]